MALFIDTLFLRVYKSNWDASTTRCCMPTDRHAAVRGRSDAAGLWSADRPGRLAVSPRDFARFGWLILQERQLERPPVVGRGCGAAGHDQSAANSIPRTRAAAAAMLPGQRTLGSRHVPDDQTDHLGSYSWAWWTNGVDRSDERLWPGVPLDVFAALGHKNGQRGMAVLPGLDMVMAWNDTTLGERPSNPHPLNTALSWLVAAVATDSPPSPHLPPKVGFETSDDLGDKTTLRHVVHCFRHGSRRAAVCTGTQRRGDDSIAFNCWPRRPGPW